MPWQDELQPRRTNGRDHLVTRLAEYLAAAGIAAVSRESIRQILRDGGVTWQAAKTWKASADPGFLPKMHRVLDLYYNPPEDGRAFCATFG